MSIKAILVPLQGIEHDIHALRGAISLAQAHDAHVTALFAQPTEEDLAATWAGYGMVAPPHQPPGGNGPRNEATGTDGRHAAGAGCA